MDLTPGLPNQQNREWRECFNTLLAAFVSPICLFLDAIAAAGARWCFLRLHGGKRRNCHWRSRAVTTLRHLLAPRAFRLFSISYTCPSCLNLCSETSLDDGVCSRQWLLSLPPRAFGLNKLQRDETREARWWWFRKDDELLICSNNARISMSARRQEASPPTEAIAFSLARFTSEIGALSSPQTV